MVGLYGVRELPKVWVGDKLLPTVLVLRCSGGRSRHRTRGPFRRGNAKRRRGGRVLAHSGGKEPGGPWLRLVHPRSCGEFPV